MPRFAFEVEITSKLRSTSGPMFYLMALNYLNGAEYQLSRILESKARLDQAEGDLAAKGETLEWQSEVARDSLLSFLDTHFYLVCMDKAYLLLRRLADNEGDSALRASWQKLQELFRPFRTARNHLEHVDERIQKHGPDLGAFHGNVWRFAGEQYPIGGEGFRRIARAVDELIGVVRDRPGRS